MNCSIWAMVAARMKRGGTIRFFASDGGFRGRLVHPRRDLSEPRNVVGGVLLGVERMDNGQRVRQVDVRAGELLERKGKVVVLLAFDDHLELPLHEVGRHALRFGQPLAIERRQLLQAAPRQLDALLPPLAGERRHLRFERVLFGAGEIPGRDRLVRVHPHPVGRERVEERVDRRRRRVRRARCEHEAPENGDEQPLHEVFLR